MAIRMTDRPVVYAVDGPIAMITLNRPEKVNAINAAMLTGLSAALDRAESDEAVGAVLLTGAGRGFCSGQDLSARHAPAGTPPPDLGESLGTRYNPLIRQIRACPLPVVAGIHGVAAGAGANLALACDVVVVGETTRIVEAFSRVGLMPDCGGRWLLERSVGRARALGLALLAAPISGETAAGWGLVWSAVPENEVLEAAREVAHRLAGGGRLEA
jgi:2-(1,2-epoxy-1,2-dihydrophenyl)acetyl-CoA isomerase